jgi:tetratricopeptide (TPR) repeat protein
MGTGGTRFRSTIGKPGPAAIALLALALTPGCRARPDMVEIRASLAPSPEALVELEAHHRFGRWLAVRPEPRSRAALMDACLLEQVGSAEEAMTLLGEELKRGASPSLLEARGALYVAAGYPRAAAGDFQEATRLAPERASSWYALGHAYQLLGLARQALEALDRAETLGERQPGLFLARARALRTLERAGAAARDFAAALEGSPVHPEEILVEAVMLAGSRPERVRPVELYRERLETFRGTPLSDDAWLLRALLKELRGGSQQEVRTAFRALDVAPAELAQLARVVLVAIQLADPETAAGTRAALLEREADTDRRFRLERCLALP